MLTVDKSPKAELILDILLASPTYTNFQKFIEINMDDKKQKTINDRLKSIDTYISKKIGVEVEKENKLNYLKIQSKDDVNKDNIVKYFLDFKVPKVGKGFDISVNLGEQLPENASNFVEVLWDSIHYYTKKLQEDFRKNLGAFVEYLKNLEELESDESRLKSEMNSISSILVQVAIKKNNTDAIIQILDLMRPLDINKVMVKKFRSLAYFAAEKGKPSILKKCLEFQDLDMYFDDENCNKEGDYRKSLFSQCLLGNHYMESNMDNAKQDDQKKDYTEDFQKCINLLITDKKFDLKALRPMHGAMKRHNTFAKEQLLNYYGLEFFAEELDRTSLENYLNSCVKEVNNDEKNHKLDIGIDFSFLDGDKEDKKSGDLENQNDFNTNSGSIKVIGNLTKYSNLKYLICHPVIATYVREKCSRYDTLYKINFIIFCVFFVMPLFVEYNFKDSYLTLIAFLFLFIREASQFYNSCNCHQKELLAQDANLKGCKLMIHSFYKALLEHFSTVSNILEFLLIISTVLVPLASFLQSDYYTGFFIIMILLGTLELTILFTETFHEQSKYFLMLRNVSRTFLKIFLMIVFFNIAFAFCFHLLLIKESKADNHLNNFSDISASFLKIMVIKLTLPSSKKTFPRLAPSATIFKPVTKKSPSLI